MIELGILAFLIMLLWFPLKWSSLKKFSSYSPRERAMLVLTAVLVVAVIFATVTTVDYFFFSQGMSCLIPFLFIQVYFVFCMQAKYFPRALPPSSAPLRPAQALYTQPFPQLLQNLHHRKFYRSHV